MDKKRSSGLLVLGLFLVVLGAGIVMFLSSRAISAVSQPANSNTAIATPLHRGRGDDPVNDATDAIVPLPATAAPNSACLATQERVDGVCVIKCGVNEERVNGECVLKCVADLERINGICVPKCLASEERLHGICVPKCGASEKRVDTACVPK